MIPSQLFCFTCINLMSPAITIDSLKAALAKLDANVSVEDILSAIEPEPMHSLSDIGPSCAACAARVTQNCMLYNCWSFILPQPVLCNSPS